MTQTDFATALLRADAPVPPGVTDPHGRVSAKRFNVYRNNVAVSLTEALETGFPVVRKLVGDAFFKAMAGVFLRTHPPASAVLSRYGDALPGFLESFPPVAHLPYLADVARLELALRTSYHAADHIPLQPETFAATPPEALPELRLKLAPSAVLIASLYPVYDIWRANMSDGAAKPRPGPQDVLVTRADYDPTPHLLLPGAFTFLRCLSEGQTFGAAAAEAATDTPEFDLSALLALAFSERFFCKDLPC